MKTMIFATLLGIALGILIGALLSLEEKHSGTFIPDGNGSFYAEEME